MVSIKRRWMALWNHLPDGLQKFLWLVAFWIVGFSALTLVAYPLRTLINTIYQ